MTTTPPDSSLRVVQVNLQRAWGGGELFTLLLGKELGRRGHHLTFLYYPDSALSKRVVAEGHEVCSLVMRAQFSLRAMLQLTRLLRALRPDVLHLHSAKEYIVGTLAGRLARVPCIVLTRHLALPVKPYMKPIYNRGCHRVACVSHAVQSELVRSGVRAEQTCVIYGAIDQSALRANLASPAEAKARLGIASGTAVIGTIGSLIAAKGHAGFLRAAALLIQDGFKGTFVIAGDGPERAALEAQAQEMDITQQVRFLGFVEDVAGVLGALDVFVLATTQSEALGLVLVEAMVAGVPVIATNVPGGVPEIVKHEETGLLVAPRDAPAMASAITRLLSDVPLRKKLQEQAQEYATRQFDALRLAQEYEALYREVLNSRGAKNKDGAAT